MAAPEIKLVTPTPDDQGPDSAVGTKPATRTLLPPQTRPQSATQLAYQTFVRERQKELVAEGQSADEARKNAIADWKKRAERAKPAEPPPAAVAPAPAPAASAPPATDAGVEKPPAPTPRRAARPEPEPEARRELRLVDLSPKERERMKAAAREEQRRRDAREQRVEAQERRARGEEAMLLMDETGRALGAIAARRGVVFSITINPGDAENPLRVRMGQMNDQGRVTWTHEAAADAPGGLGRAVVGILRSSRVPKLPK